MMLPLIIEVTEYIKESNVCVGKMITGKCVEFDPFVSCAIEMTDDEYENGKGNDTVGKTFVIWNFNVSKIASLNAEFCIIPDERGMTNIY